MSGRRIDNREKVWEHKELWCDEDGAMHPLSTEGGVGNVLASATEIHFL